MARIILFFCFLFSFSVQAWNQAVYAPEPNWYQLYDIRFYDIELEANDTTTFIKGHTTVNLAMKSNSDSLVFDFNPLLQLDSILVDGKSITRFYFQKDYLILKPSKDLTNNSYHSATIYYQGEVKTNSFFSSMSSEIEPIWKIPVTWTLSEPFGAKYWFPCKQKLSDKADSVYVFITVPQGLKAGANGKLCDTVALDGHKTQFKWKSGFPIAYYLISFTVSDYQDYSYYLTVPGQKDSMLVQNYIYNRPGYFEKYKTDIDRTADFIKLYSKLFGLYPFYKEKYGHCVAPIGGGMEHQTMTTLYNFGFSLVSHELGHQWFGDNSTCSTWQDIWVNEGFASYCEYLAYEYLISKSEADSWMNNAQSGALREPEGSVFIPVANANDEYRLFSSNLSYKKGAVILHILRNIINNDTVFFNGLKQYVQSYSLGNASGTDFQKVMENESGMDLTNFFNQWFYGKGYPLYDITWNNSNDSIIVNVNQTASSSAMSFFATPFEMKFYSTDKDTVVRFNQTKNPQVFSFKYEQPVSVVIFDPNGWMLKKVQSVIRVPQLPSDDDYFSIKPNPFRDSIMVSFKSLTSKDDKISVLGLNGKIFLDSYVKKKKEFNLATSDLSPGVYLVVVTHEGHKYVRKVVKAGK